ncbi:hypothetical protein [uncultured Croceitalea sp.]|uniref:hypothetical protein n=1 Tax=uncultured Croceitalea sp. TaxID=1798908 RepID=UPI003305B7E3
MPIILDSLKQIVVCVLLCAAKQIAAQETVVLKTVPFVVASPNFYIDKIIDDRAEKFLTQIKNEEGDKVPMTLYPNLSEALDTFVTTSIAKAEFKKPIVVKVKTLRIQESRINETEVIARVDIHLVFYEKKGRSLKECYQISHSEDEVFEAPLLLFSKNEEVSATHEKRIRAAIEYCILAFVANQNEQQEALGHFDHVDARGISDRSLNKWYNIISYRQILTSTYHKGWALGYTGFLDSDRDFIVPYELNFEQYVVKDDFAAEQGFEYVDSYVLRPGLFGYKKIVPGIYGAVGINLPVGIEAAKGLNDDDEKYRFLIGIGASQGVKIISWKRNGIVFGIEFFQQIQNSEIYTRDIGLEFSIGVNF